MSAPDDIRKSQRRVVTIRGDSSSDEGRPPGSRGKSHKPPARRGGWDPAFSYPWQKVVFDAILAWGTDELPVKRMEAALEVSLRLREHSVIDLNEHLALRDAMRVLERLRAENVERPRKSEPLVFRSLQRSETKSA